MDMDVKFHIHILVFCFSLFFVIFLNFRHRVYTLQFSECTKHLIDR